MIRYPLKAGALLASDATPARRRLKAETEGWCSGLSCRWMLLVAQRLSATGRARLRPHRPMLMVRNCCGIAQMSAIQMPPKVCTARSWVTPPAPSMGNPPTDAHRRAARAPNLFRNLHIRYLHTAARRGSTMRHNGQSSQFMFRDALWRHVDKTAVVVNSRRYSYRELDELSTRLAAQLRALGLTKGNRLAIALRNCVELAVTGLAILKLDAVGESAVARDAEPQRCQLYDRPCG